MGTNFESLACTFFLYLPSVLVALNFLPCGLVFGYTIASFVAERNWNAGLSQYGPLILGACWASLAALGMFLVKFFKGRIIFWHVNVLIGAGVFNLIASGFYFADNLDNVGAYISYLAHALIFLAGLSFLHSIPGKCTRAVLLSLCFTFYLLGIASAISLIGTTYGKNIEKHKSPNPKEVELSDQLIDGIYVRFAGVYLSISVVMLAMLIGLKVLDFLGNVDCETSMDNDFRIANSNGSIFDKRQEIIKRIQFFYVTRNQQWNVTLVLLFTEAVQYSLFIYFIFWFSLNTAVRLTSIGNVDVMFWMVFLGGAISSIVLIFISAKVMFVSNNVCLIALTILGMVVSSSAYSSVPFWLILFFFGMSFSNLQIIIVEVSHFRLTEVLICTSYLLKLLSTSIVYFYYVANSKNSYFYSTDEATMMAQGFVFIIISALLALVVGMKVPRTHRTSLFDVQYGLLGIIFKKHQIEQLNVKWLHDGTIPTISRPDGY